MELNQPPGFSITERRVGVLVAAGFTNAVIANRLLLTVQAVEWSVAKLCRALEADSREELETRLGELSAG
jgi:DNA-binding NarL/FixJ family response regulator